MLANTKLEPILPISATSTTSTSSSDGLSSPNDKHINPMLSPLSPEQSASLVHNLPQELLDAGWRRFWSGRENREYFYNKITKESLWEMPHLDNHSKLPKLDSYSDPLGIHPGESQMILNTRTASKRLSSDESTRHPSKRIALLPSPYWDFSINSNVTLGKPMPFNSLFFHPHPDIEQLRAFMVAKLRKSYQDLCILREGIDAPAESFNRWLLERSINNKGPDPLLPSNTISPLSQAMFREILNDVPIRLSKPRRCEDARKMLAKYAEAAKSLMEKRGSQLADGRKVVTWHAQETFAFLQKKGNATYDNYLDRLAHLKKYCQPFIIDTAKQSVESICLKVNGMACEYSKKIREKHEQLLKQAGVDFNKLSSPSFPLSPSSSYSCSPIFLSTPPPPPNVVIEHQEVNDLMVLKAKFINGVDQVKINTSHFQKLEQLYQINCRHDLKMDHFLTRTWCLLKRYQTFFGPKENEGFGLQGALPVQVFQWLYRNFGVTFECFASPLNCFFKQYCSAFVDTDCYYGSRGSILNFYPKSGSFEANPPFNEELMDTMVDHFENLLMESNEPLSFVIFIPDWKDPPTEALLKLESSRFKRQQLTIPAMKHEYRHGFQHICSKKDLNVKSVHGTLVIFLQNEAGNLKWPATPEKLKELLLVYQQSPHDL